LSVLYFLDGVNQFECRRVSKLDISFFSLENQYTSESGNTIVYPIKMQKIRINFTAEVYGSEYQNILNILKNPEFKCLYKSPESDEPVSRNFMTASDISTTKIMSGNGIKGGLYAISATLEEV